MWLFSWRSNLLFVWRFTYTNFFHFCLQIKFDKRNTFLIMKNQKNCFIGCYFDFINKKDYSDIDWKTLRTQCFYFDNDDVDSVSCMDASFFSISNFCFFCQRVILQEQSCNLHILLPSLFRSWKKSFVFVIVLLIITST